MRPALLVAVTLVTGCASIDPRPLPVSLPQELGSLKVVESSQRSGGTDIALTYVNSTEQDLRDVRVECILLDHRDQVVNTDNEVVKNAPKGTEHKVLLNVRDANARATRAECRVMWARFPDTAG